MKAAVEFLWWWVMSGVVYKVIFVSSLTTVLSVAVVLCYVFVGVVTKYEYISI